MSNKRYIYYNCKNLVYHKNLQTNTLYTKHNINVSTYIPLIIKQMINSIPKKHNNNYIICPFYSNLYNYQLGITETSKLGESSYDTIVRGINEECGLTNITWYENYIYSNRQGNKNWFGVCINNNNYDYEPNIIINNNNDNNNNKVGIIIYNCINNLLNKYKHVNSNDIQTDDISGLGFISIYDCKQIIKRHQL